MPAPTAVTTPDEFTVAAPVFELVQVPPVGAPERVTDVGPAVHRFAAPDIVGSAFTTIVLFTGAEHAV